MGDVAMEIEAKIRSLRPFSDEGWDSGPYSEDRIREAEQHLGRPLDRHHEAMLKRIGGNFSFELGAVEVNGVEGNVSFLCGLGEKHPNAIVNEWRAYRGQIPQNWYPFAMDSYGHLYCLTEHGAVHHIHLEEELWTRAMRPETSGQRIADSFAEFVMSLQLPDWAIAYYEQQDR